MKKLLKFEIGLKIKVIDVKNEPIDLVLKRLKRFVKYVHIEMQKN